MAKHTDWSLSESSQESCIHEFIDRSHNRTCRKCGKEEQRLEIVAELPIVRSGPDQGRLIGANLAPGQNDVAHSDSSYFHGKIKDMRRLGTIMKIPSPVIKQSEELYRKIARRKYVRSAYPNYLSMFIATRNEPHNQLMLFDFWEKLGVERIALSKPLFRIKKSDILYQDADGQSDRICTFPPRNKTYSMLARFYDELFPDIAQNDEYERVTILREAGLFFERMEKNCLHTGRNPRSLYGACLLLAVTLHGKSIDIAQVANAVRMSESILNKRLREFKNTPGTGQSIDDYLDSPASEWQTNPLPPCMTQRKTDDTYSPDRYLQDSTSDVSYSINGLHDSGDEISLASEDERDAESYLLEPEVVQYRTELWEKEFGNYTPQRKRNYIIPFTPEKYHAITSYFPSHSQASSQEEVSSVARPVPAPERRKRHRRKSNLPIQPGSRRITDFFSTLNSQESFSSIESPITPTTHLSEDSEIDLIEIHPFSTPEPSLTKVQPAPHPYMTPPYSENGDELDFSLSDNDPNFIDLHGSPNSNGNFSDPLNLQSRF